ncbi:MAG: ABC transporter permease [Thermomicrobiales bacterium]
MLSYIARRIVMMVPTLFVASILIFGIIQLPPTDFASSMAAQAAQSGSSVDEQTLAAIRHRYGLDQPIHMQYLHWLGGLVQGDLGYSFEWGRPVSDLILGRIVYTMILAVAAIVFMWVVAIPIGVYSATHQYSPLDHILTFVGFIGLAVPEFLLGLIYLFVAALVFNMSVGGFFSPEMEDAAWSLAKVWDLIKHMFFPTVILALGGTAQLIRIMRSSLLDTLRQPFVTTARAKGLSERVAVWKYAVRVAINPLLSVMGMQIPTLISGATILGAVLSIPTIGPMFLRSLINVDMYLAGAFLLFAVVLLMIGNLLADIALAWVDPRIRYQ